MSSRAFSWRDTLQHAAKVEGVELSEDDVEEILKASDDSPLAKWVGDNLDLSNTLTAEELFIWEHLHKTRSKSSKEIEDEIPVVPLTEADLQKAIAALEATTNSTKSHITTLQRQNTLLAPDRSDDRLGKTSSLAVQNVYERRQQTEAQQLKFHNAEISTNLKSELKVTQEKIEKTIRALSSRTTERLRSDDRIFETLNETSTNSRNIISTIEINNDDASRVSSTSQTQTQIQSLLSSLRKATTLYSQLHTSTTYLQTLTSSTSVPTSLSRVHDSEIQHLQADLSSLHDSIEDIAAMLVHSLHGQNITSTLQRLETTQNDTILQDVLYMQDSIAKMTRELENLAEKIELLSSYRVVVDEIDRELDRISTESQNQSQPSNLTSNLPQIQQSRLTKTTTMPIQPPLSPALSSLLQNLNLNIPPTTAPVTSTAVPTPTLSSKSTTLPTPELPSFHPLQTQIIQSSRSLLPSITSLLPTTTTKTTKTKSLPSSSSSPPIPSSTSISSSSSTSAPFTKELTTLTNLESKINEAKIAVEKIAAGD